VKAREPERKPLVLHVAPTPFFSDRGCHLRIQGIVTALECAGAGSIVCTYHHGRDVAGVTTRRIGTVPGYSSREPGPNRHKYRADWKLLWLTVRTVARSKPDLIHGHLHEGILIGWLARCLCFWRRIPLVGDLQGSLVDELDSYGYFRRSTSLRRLFRLVENVILRLPRHLTISSAGTLEQVHRSHGVLRQRTTLIADRVCPSHFGDGGDDRADRPVTLVYSGSLLRSKGLADLHQLLGLVLERRPELHALVVGSPRETTLSFLTERGLEDRCTLTGTLRYELLPEYLARADIGIDPKGEGSSEGSAKIVNYMAAGLPVVAFETRNNRELLGEEAYLAPPGDIDALRARVEVLLDHPELRRREGRRNRQRVEERLSWEDAAPLLQEIYRRVSPRRAAGRWVRPE